MALQVWLPLNGNLENKGLSNYVFSNKEATISDTGKIGQSYLFNGTSSVIYNNNIAPIGNKWTVGGWFLFNVMGETTQYAVSFSNDGKGGTAAHQFGFGVYTSGPAVWVNGTVYNITHDDLIIDSWVHIMMAFDGQTAYVYVNGELARTINDADIVTGKFFTLGARSNSESGAGSSASYYFQGQLNDIRLYDECLSLTQIREISKGLIAHYPLTGPGGNENLILTSGTIVSSGHASGITCTHESDGSFKVISESGNGNYCSIHFAQNSNTNVGEKIAVGDKYTISCDIKVEVGTAFPDLFINSGNGYKTLKGDISKIGEWQRVYYTNTWAEPGTQYGNISLHLGFSDAIGTYYFKNFKLEKGGLTMWTPAPTDTEYTSLGYKDNWKQDVSGFGYNANVTGSLTFNEDSPRYCGSTQFYGNGYLNNIPSSINTSTDSFTFTCWYYPTAHTTGALYNNRTVMGSGVSVFHAGSGIRFDTGDVSQMQAGTLTLNKWQHIACVYDKINGFKKIYINGTEVGNSTSIGNLNQIGTIASIGASSTNDAGAGNTLSGSLSDVRIYGTALDDADIIALYSHAGKIDNLNNWYAYDFIELSNNKFVEVNSAVLDKKWASGLSRYTQANCDVTMTDDGIRIYRPPNIVHDSTTMHNMWGGFRISPMLVNTNSLQKGHTYIILLDVKGQTTNAAVCGWTNNMGWGGGGLNPAPSNVVYKWIPANWQSDEYVTFFYKWTIEDDIYKTCTSSYSSFVAGEEYISYRDFGFNFNYQDTGTLGTDIYVRNLRCYDITNLDNATIEQEGAVLAAALQENNQSARIHFSGEIGGNKIIEI